VAPAVTPTATTRYIRQIAKAGCDPRSSSWDRSVALGETGLNTITLPGLEKCSLQPHYAAIRCVGCGSQRNAEACSDGCATKAGVRSTALHGEERTAKLGSVSRVPAPRSSRRSSRLCKSNSRSKIPGRTASHQSGASETITACRDPKAAGKNREKWPQKRPSCLQGLTSRLLEVANAVWRNQSPRPNSLLTGQLTGNLLVLAPFEQERSGKKPRANGLLRKNSSLRRRSP
jgi:hypothetical protein